LLTCKYIDGCFECLNQLINEEKVLNLSSNIPCNDLMASLHDNDLCSKVKILSTELLVCDILNSVPTSDDEDDDYNDDDDYDDDNNDDDDNEDDDYVDEDCEALTSCDWEGMHKGYLGDGICHEHVNGGCYNHKICNYDNGDCCEDTCKKEKHYNECGSNGGYFCRDPNSTNAEFLVNDSETNDDWLDDDVFDDDWKSNALSTDLIENGCPKGTTKYRLLMYDSYGGEEGWGNTEIKIFPKGATKEEEVIYLGGLNSGSSGTAPICLSSKDPMCYEVTTFGGNWAKEATWEIKPLVESPFLASGGAPMACEFPVNGILCENTCKGVPATKDVAIDKSYESFSDLETCRNSKCVLEKTFCEKDASCKDCFAEDVPVFCYTNDIFKKLASCVTDNCVKKSDKKEIKKEKETKDTGDFRQCTSSDVIDGLQSTELYTQCAEIEQDEMKALFSKSLYNYSFGPLFAFENCAHSWSNEKFHGGKSALDCMGILANAIDDPSNNGLFQLDEVTSNAVSKLAEKIYNDAENFCGCSSESSRLCPPCEAFKNYKTLLYESLNACQSLDAIDCAAWDLFYDSCKINFENKFGKSNIQFKSKHCNFISKDKCGLFIPKFPTFRKLDCQDELDEGSWDFYLKYETNCIKEDNSSESETSTQSSTSSTSDPSSPSSASSSSTSSSSASSSSTSSSSTSSKPAPDTTKPNSDQTKSTKYTPKPPMPKSSTIASEGDKESNPVDTAISAPEDENDIAKREKSESKSKGGAGKVILVLFLLTLFSGTAFIIYKKRTSFDYIRYRRNRNYGPSDGMYEGLNFDGGGSSFEPPSLPPPPSAYVGPSIA